jgi:Ran GTPase-activating protein (RanGAP) involved in mRNA processing and transport
MKSLRIWDGDLGDQGVRYFFEFIDQTNKSCINLIEWLNCGIGVLGCEFVSRIFDPKLSTNIQILTLDYNNFGNDGLCQLMTNLKGYDKLKHLSLAYCGITEFGIQHLREFLASTTMEMDRLILQGNQIKNNGFNELLDYLLLSNIEEINLNNVLVGGDTEIMQKFSTLITNNKNIVAYQMKFNFLDDKGRNFRVNV